MPEYDVVIRGGTIVEGTGVPRYKADLAIKNGRVAMITGTIKAAGAKELDASGCYVAPGAIDLHTHYDAQLNWDPYASLSGWFGVTSLTIGLCGFGFAPMKPEDRDLSMLMMNRIEAIPLESMRRGMRWDWITFPEYLNSLDSQGLGINVAALVGFNPLRGYVMGMRPARQRLSATEAELNQMKQIFYDAMKAGAFGISGNESLEDRNEEGGPLPSHIASKEEWLGLAEVLSEFGIGHMGWSAGQLQTQTVEQVEASREWLRKLMITHGRPMNVALTASEEWMWAIRADGPGMACQKAIMPPWARFTLAEYNLFDYMESWVKPLVGTPEERAAKLRDQETRAAMRADAEGRFAGRSNTDYNRIWIVETVLEKNSQYEGMNITELASAVNKDPLDAWLDLAIEEGLQTTFTHLIGGQTDEDMEVGIKDPFGHINLSDGGAHVKYATIASWPMYFLFHWVRDKQVMSLEEAAYKMSAYPAWIAGLRDRGMLRIGSWADIIVYDLDKLGYMLDRFTYANDFPGGERRVIQKPTGLRYTLVNGGVTFDGAECTGALPGKLLRSYDMIN